VYSDSSIPWLLFLSSRRSAQIILWLWDFFMKGLVSRVNDDDDDDDMILKEMAVLKGECVSMMDITDVNPYEVF
jgi:hypothetical protein